MNEPMTPEEKLDAVSVLVEEFTAGMDLSDIEKGMRAAGKRIKEEILEAPSAEPIKEGDDE